MQMPIKFVKKNINYLNAEVLRIAEGFYQCRNVKEPISGNFFSPLKIYIYMYSGKKQDVVM